MCENVAPFIFEREPNLSRAWINPAQGSEIQIGRYDITIISFSVYFQSPRWPERTQAFYRMNVWV